MGVFWKGVAAVFAGLLAVSAPAAAAGIGQSTSSAHEYAETLPPIGFVDFCQRNPQACEPTATRTRKLAMTQQNWLLVRMVNSFVNGSIAPVTDETLYGTPEYWTYPADAGDCEDLVLLKKKILSEKGIPAEALRITVVLDEHGEGHAVLSPTRRGNATGYPMVKRQSAQVPRKGVALEPLHSQPTLAGTASK